MVAPLVARLRRRRFLQRLVYRWLWLAPLVGVAAAVWGGWGTGLAVSGTLLVATLWEAIRLPSLHQLALDLDRATGSGDRLITALSLEGATEPMAQAAVMRCEAWAEGFDFRPFFPWRVPWKALGVALLPVLGAVWFHAVETPRLPDAEVLRVAAELEALSTTLPQEGAVAQELAEAMAQAAKAVRHHVTSPEARREVLRELSLLEGAMAAGNLPLESLAETFSGDEELAEALQRKDATAAAQRLETMASLAPTALATMEEAMAQAAGKLGDTPLARAAQRASEALKKGETETSREALRQMAEALRQAGGEEQQRQRMAQAVQEMKTAPPGGEAQQGNEPPEAPPAQEEQEGGVLVEKGRPPGDGEGLQAQGGDGQEAGGVPGSERDRGSKATPFGSAATEAPERAGLQTQLRGMLGEGESLHSLIATQGGEGRSERRYRDLYESTRPAAEEALDKETIPLGSRLLIRRYFEAIRPTP